MFFLQLADWTSKRIEAIRALDLAGWEKLSKIVFAGVGAFVIAFVGYQLKRDAYGLQSDSECLQRSETIRGMILSENVLDNIFGENFLLRCGFSQGFVDTFSEVSRSIARVGHSVEGWVHLGSAVNRAQEKMMFFAGPDMQRMSADNWPAEGDTIISMGQVHFRGRNDPASRSNPELGIAYPGNCLLLLTDPEEQEANEANGRTAPQWWVWAVRVSPSECYPY